MKLKSRHLILSSVLTLAVAATAVFSSISTAVATEPSAKADLTKAMSVTVNANDGAKEYIEKLTETDGKLVYDLYKVADVADKGSGIAFTLTSDFSDLTEGFKTVMDINGGADQKKFMHFAQDCLAKKFNDGDTVVAKSPAYEGRSLESKEAVDPGMYLLVVRGTEADSTVVKNYAINSADSSQEGSAQDGLATVTKLGGYSFTCSPILFAAPNKAEALATTADANEWIYDQTIVLKMIAEPENGSIIIDKKLTGYNPGAEDATFIFQVDVEFPAGTPYSSEVYSTKFTEAGNESIQVDGIPYGAKVIVTEVYSGVAYECTSAKSQTINELERIESAAEIPHVAFENKYTDWQGGGGGITNHFTYVEGEGGATWDWKKVDGNVTTQNGRPNAFSKQAEGN